MAIYRKYKIWKSFDFVELSNEDLKNCKLFDSIIDKIKNSNTEPTDKLLNKIDSYLILSDNLLNLIDSYIDILLDLEKSEIAGKIYYHRKNNIIHDSEIQKYTKSLLYKDIFIEIKGGSLTLHDINTSRHFQDIGLTEKNIIDILCILFKIFLDIDSTTYISLSTRY